MCARVCVWSGRPQLDPFSPLPANNYCRWGSSMGRPIDTYRHMVGWHRCGQGWAPVAPMLAPGPKDLTMAGLIKDSLDCPSESLGLSGKGPSPVL